MTEVDFGLFLIVCCLFWFPLILTYQNVTSPDRYEQTTLILSLVLGLIIFNFYSTIVVIMGTLAGMFLGWISLIIQSVILDIPTIDMKYKRE